MRPPRFGRVFTGDIRRLHSILRRLLAISDVSIPSCGVYFLIRIEGCASEPVIASQEFDRLPTDGQRVALVPYSELLQPSLSKVVHSDSEGTCLHNKRYV